MLKARKNARSILEASDDHINQEHIWRAMLAWKGRHEVSGHSVPYKVAESSHGDRQVDWLAEIQTSCQTYQTPGQEGRGGFVQPCHGTC